MPYKDIEDRRAYDARYKRAHYHSQRADLSHGRKFYHLKLIKRRARHLGVPFELTEASIFYPTHCPILRLKLDYNAKRNEWNAPQLDRIDPGLGYVRGNVHVISRRGNQLKGQRTRAELAQALDDWDNSPLSRWAYIHEVEALVMRWPEVVTKQPEGVPMEHA